MLEVASTQPRSLLIPFPHSNRFVAGFLIPNQPNLVGLREVTGEIAEERKAWMQSDAAKELSDLWMKAWQDFKIIKVAPSERQKADSVLAIQSYLYGEVEEKVGGLVDQVILRQLSPKGREVVDGICSQQAAHRLDYRTSIKHLVEQQRELSQALTTGTVEFVSADHRHLRDFANFMIEDGYSTQREANRPDGEAIERHRRAEFQRNNRVDFLEAARRDLSTKAQTVFPEEEFMELVGKLLETNPVNGNERTSIEWLRLMTYPSDEVDIQALYNRIQSSQIFPRELKTLLLKTFETDLTTKVTQARQALETYKGEGQGPAVIKLQTTGGHRQGPRLTKMSVTGTKPQVETPKRPEFQMLMHGFRDISDERLADYLEDRTKYFTNQDDPTMLADLKAIVTSLKDDPRGLGVGILALPEVLSADGHKALALWHLRPEKRPTLNLTHELARKGKVRVVYYFDSKVFPNTIVLADILHHDDFDDKYTRKKRPLG